jgi:hypothetical protein
VELERSGQRRWIQPRWHDQPRQCASVRAHAGGFCSLLRSRRLQRQRPIDQGGFVFCPPQSPGDFNADGLVNGSDFLLWQREFGGSLNDADLDAWAQNFGNPLLVAATGTVPEPTGASLVLLASAALALCRLRLTPTHLATIA